MKTKLIAIVLACALLICGVALAEQDRPRVDTADRIVYRITNGKYRILDMNGKFIGDDSDVFPSDQIGETAVYMDHGRYGYVLKDGTVLFEPDYLYLPDFENGYAVVCKEDIDATVLDDYSGVARFPRICGVINVYGDAAVPVIYDYARITADADYAVVGVKGDDFSPEGLFDLEQGRITVEPEYYSIDDPHGGTAVACECAVNRDSKNTSSDEWVYKYGIINVKGEKLTPFEYDRIEYNDGFNAYSCYTDEQLIKIYEIDNGTVVEKTK